jgi:alpha-glucosidase
VTAGGAPPGEHLWWQEGVIYQVYPRSFADASGDGVGDLRGVAGKLDYLRWLGVDAVWLSPIFTSPMADFGYDVADYTGIDPLFGTMEDFERLLEDAHQRGMKVLLDFVPNHTSDEHPWFVESRSSRDNPKRDWYVWRDPAPDGGPPNNWLSYFGGGAWEWDETTGQYYLRLFDRKQPDLNWRNPEVREAMYDVMRFWFEKGVDGFRIDVLWLLIKDEHFRDNPPNPGWREGGPPWASQTRLYSEDRPEIHEIVRQMRAVADSYEERVLIGEIYLPLERLMAYYGETLDGVHLPFNFLLVVAEGWHADTVRDLVAEYEAALPEGAWPNWVLGNHDQSRIASRVGPDQARVAKMLLLTLRGTPTLYYGDEIGLQDGEIPPHLVKDPQGINSPGHGRDGARTPMQWDASPNAGFCPEGAEPWLPVSDDFEKNNVAAQKEDPRSMLSLTRELLRLRRGTPALSVGSYEALDGTPADVLAYVRRLDGQGCLVALNFSGEEKDLDLSGVGPGGVVLSTLLDREGLVEGGVLRLRPNEGCVVELGRGA